MRLRREDGSLPLALLAVIIVAGLVAVLTARTIAGQRSARFDRDFTEVFYAADAGVEQALYELNYTNNLKTVPVGSTATTGGSACTPALDLTLDDTSYDWCLERTAERAWTVTSIGELNGVDRQVIVDIVERPKFFGAFGDVLLASNGANLVDSYNSDPACSLGPADCGWGVDADGNGELDGTGNGAIGSNDKVELQGNSTTVDKTYLYNWRDNPGAGATADQNVDPGGDRCDHTSGGGGEGSGCRAPSLTRTPEDRIILEPLDVGSPNAMQDITAAINHCKTHRGDPLPDWVASDNAGALAPAVAPVSEPQIVMDGQLQDADFYCFDDVTFDTDTTLVDASASDPVIIYVEGSVTVPDPHTRVNCFDASLTGECQHRVDLPVAEALQIFSEGGDVGIKSGSSFAGVIYAPKAICAGFSGGGGAGVDIYGGMTCGSLNNVGNWSFHFDDGLAGEGTGEFDVARYREDG